MTDRSTLTVFVVDDDAAIRDSLGLLLGLSGYRCAQFASGEAFLAAFRPEWRGCVLADLRMPGMDGLQLQEAIARQSDIPFVMITAHGDVAAARQAFKLRAVDFLEKPFTDEAVIAAIETAFGAEVSRSRESTAHAARDRLLAALTEREREVAMLVVQGMHNRDIGTQLGISPRTVEVHKARIMEKCGAGGLADLIRLFHAAPAPRERRGP